MKELTLCRLTDVLPTGDAEQDAMDKKRYVAQHFRRRPKIPCGPLIVPALPSQATLNALSRNCPADPSSPSESPQNSLASNAIENDVLPAKKPRV